MQGVPTVWRDGGAPYLPPPILSLGFTLLLHVARTPKRLQGLVHFCATRESRLVGLLMHETTVETVCCAVPSRVFLGIQRCVCKSVECNCFKTAPLWETYASNMTLLLVCWVLLREIGRFRGFRWFWRRTHPWRREELHAGSSLRKQLRGKDVSLSDGAPSSKDWTMRVCQRLLWAGCQTCF